MMKSKSILTWFWTEEYFVAKDETIFQQRNIFVCYNSLWIMFYTHWGSFDVFLKKLENITSW